MKKIKYVLLSIVMLSIFCENSIAQSDHPQFTLERLGPDSFRNIFEFNIAVKFSYNLAFVDKIFTHNLMSENFLPDFVGHDTFRTTELLHYGTEEYLAKYRRYWDHFGEYMEKFKKQGIDDYNERTILFYKTIYEEIGIRQPKDVNIAYSKEDLVLIEKDFINSKYLRELDTSIFDNCILVFIVFHHTGWLDISEKLGTH